MKILAWNCRGLGNRLAVQELVDIVQAQDPSIVFLFETWSDWEQMVGIKERLDFGDLCIVPSEGRGGGLALLWKSNIKVWVDSFSKYHIDSVIEGGSENAWRLTGFYGKLDTYHRSEGWSMLCMLGSKLTMPWCCLGDFNELLEVQDKKGGAPRAQSQMQMFRDALDYCEFVDLGFSSPDFT